MSRVGQFLKEKDAEMTKYTRVKTAMWAGFFSELQKIAIPAHEFIAQQEARNRAAGLGSDLRAGYRPAQRAKIEAAIPHPKPLVPPGSYIPGSVTTKTKPAARGAITFSKRLARYVA